MLVDAADAARSGIGCASEAPDRLVVGRVRVEVSTDLAVPVAMCNVAYGTRLIGTRGGTGEKVAEMRVYVGGSEGPTPGEPISAVVAWEFRSRLYEELGQWSEYVRGERSECFYWHRADVVLGLDLHESFVLLNVVNPRYERWVRSTRSAPRSPGAKEM